MFSYILAPLHININLQGVSELLTCFEGSMVSEDSQITCGWVNWLSLWSLVHHMGMQGMA